jgi:hypothetical protein
MLKLSSRVSDVSRRSSSLAVKSASVSPWFMALVEQAVAGRPNDLLDQLAAVGQGHFDAAPPATSLHAAVEAGVYIRPHFGST